MTHKPLPPRKKLVEHMVRSMALAGSVLAVALGIGIVGYHVWGGLPWLDALVNASMILGGMGPVDPITSADGKWFASFYALFSGVVLLGSVGVLFAPVIHRFLHHFHLEVNEPPGHNKG
jgi:hypothetical protein